MTEHHMLLREVLNTDMQIKEIGMCSGGTFLHLKNLQKKKLEKMFQEWSKKNAQNKAYDKE